ncbi:MAG: hypothetical protein OXH08_03850, partial [Gammaproteobacteria bacterium]|nr:hypothetical protein [Gammaproteobacteria bacterium]
LYERRLRFVRAIVRFLSRRWTARSARLKPRAGKASPPDGWLTARWALRRLGGKRLDAIVSGSVRHRGPARASAALSPAAAARSRGGGCPIILGQACHLPVEPLDLPLQDFVLLAQPLDVLPQGFVLSALPLDVPPQGFDLPGLPPLFRFVLRGQQMGVGADLVVSVGLTDSAARIPAD